MVHLLDHVQPESVRPVSARKREGIIREVLEPCLAGMDPNVAEAVVKEVIDSRRSSNQLDMSLGNGFALVHSRQDQCPDLRVAVGLLPQRLKLYRGEKIHTVIGIVLPSSQSRQYLAFLARFGRLMYTAGAATAFEDAGKLMAAGQIETARTGLLDFIRLFEEG